MKSAGVDHVYLPLGRESFDRNAEAKALEDKWGDRDTQRLLATSCPENGQLFGGRSDAISAALLMVLGFFHRSCHLSLQPGENS